MIYLLIILFFLWLVTVAYFLKHIRHILNELTEIDKEQHQQNMDIIHLLKMDVEITKVLDHNSKVLNDTNKVVEYLLDINDKVLVKNKLDIFSPPKGEA